LVLPKIYGFFKAHIKLVHGYLPLFTHLSRPDHFKLLCKHQKAELLVNRIEGFFSLSHFIQSWLNSFFLADFILVWLSANFNSVFYACVHFGIVARMISSPLLKLRDFASLKFIQTPDYTESVCHKKSRSQSSNSREIKIYVHSF